MNSFAGKSEIGAFCREGGDVLQKLETGVSLRIAVMLYRRNEKMGTGARANLRNEKMGIGARANLRHKIRE